MNRVTFRMLLFLASLALAACAGSDELAKCGFSGQTTLADPADAAWPKFARDTANSGRIEGVRIAAGAEVRWVFPPEQEEPLQPISGTAVVGDDGQIRFAGVETSSGFAELKLYVLDAADGSVLNKITPTPLATPEATPTPAAPTILRGGSITASPLLAADGTVYLALNDGTLRRIEEDEESAVTVSTIGGFLSASPNIADDGTVYLGSLGGSFAAICPNGIARFVLPSGPTQSTAAVVDGTDAAERLIVVADDDAQVRALDYKGRQRWVFFASAAVRGSVVAEHSESEPGQPADRLFVADGAGWVFALGLADGTPVWSRRPGDGSPISATPALGTGVVYVADEGGTLYALRTETGETQWSCTAGGAIRSSPAVATTGGTDAVVFGADDGTVYAVDSAAAAACTVLQECGCDEVALWAIDVGSPVGRASPSIDFDGTVYVGTEGGRLYAIGAPVQEPTATATGTSTSGITPTPTPTASQ